MIWSVLTGTVRIWHANTYRLESTLNYGLERVWAIAAQKGSNNVALGYDEGSIIIKVTHCNYAWKGHYKKEYFCCWIRYWIQKMLKHLTCSILCLYCTAWPRGTSHVNGQQWKDHLGQTLGDTAGQHQGYWRPGREGWREAPSGGEGHGQLWDLPPDSRPQPQWQVSV